MDCMVGAYGQDNKNIYEGIRMLLLSQRLDPLVVKAYQRRQINYEQLEYILKSFHARSQNIIEEIVLERHLSGEPYYEHTTLDDGRLSPKEMRHTSKQMVHAVRNRLLRAADTALFAAPCPKTLEMITQKRELSNNFHFPNVA
eukprot:12405794-Karenia_brevis.AAC.1